MTQVERLQSQGIRRHGSPRSGFRYRHAAGHRPRTADLERIRALRLPPAWREVAINPSPNGRLQAVGRDAAGRWQYVYHANHVRERERKKLTRLVQFGGALPRLRKALRHDLRRRGLPREKVLAVIVRILSSAFIRPGSEAYAAENGSYGIATLRRKHTHVDGDSVQFDFPGKSGKRQFRRIRDPLAARVIRQLLALPGYEVFKYERDGEIVDVRRTDINAYIKENMGERFSAKDFRTWSATLICASALARGGCADTERARKRALVAAVKETAHHLGNTPAICRASYISPCVLSSYQRGVLVDASFEAVEDLLSNKLRGLHPAERALLELLRKAA